MTVDCHRPMEERVLKRLIGYFIVVILILLWTATAFSHDILKLIGRPQSIEKLAYWGETFGALNAAFALFGFLAVLVTLGVQQRQISSNTRDQHRQVFESSFFKLLQLLREVRDSVSFRYSEEYIQGKAHDHGGKMGKRPPKGGVQAFRAAWNEASFWIADEDPTNSAHLGTIYEIHVHRRYESNLSPYFRLLYNIMRKIHDDKILTNDEKVFYQRLLRSQLNSYEVAVAALNGLAPFSRDFADLFTDARMLKYLPEGNRRQILTRFYPQRAFTARSATH